MKKKEWQKFWDFLQGPGEEFPLELGLVLTRTYCSLAQTRSLASLEWLEWNLEDSLISPYVLLAAFLYLVLFYSVG